MDVITSGEVGPELEQYVNALLDRLREAEAREERLREDTERLKWLANCGWFFDEFCGVDLHLRSRDHFENGKDMRDAYLCAIRDAIDAGRELEAK